MIQQFCLLSKSYDRTDDVKSYSLHLNISHSVCKWPWQIDEQIKPVPILSVLNKTRTSQWCTVVCMLSVYFLRLCHFEFRPLNPIWSNGFLLVSWQTALYICWYNTPSRWVWSWYMNTERCPSDAPDRALWLYVQPYSDKQKINKDRLS